MKALGLDYSTVCLNNNLDPDLTKPESIFIDDKRQSVLRLIEGVVSLSYRGGARIFTPHTKTLHHFPQLDRSTHARILQAQIVGLRRAFNACLRPTAEIPQVFLWAATFMPLFQNSQECSAKEIVTFHTTQAEVAQRYDIPIYYGTIGSKRGALLAAIGAERAGMEKVTIGFAVGNDGKLIYDKSSPSEVIDIILNRFGGTTFGFDHCSLTGAEAAFYDLQAHQKNGFFTTLFPYHEEKEGAWDVQDWQTRMIESPTYASVRVFDLAQRFSAQWTGWPCAHTADDLATLTSKLRYSKKNRILIPEIGGQAVSDTLQAGPPTGIPPDDSSTEKDIPKS